ncbi:pseudouridine synthase [Tricladium varicosporioides]|nr:pseudouridine synthase [Hymenoscyphus varicosporioides]
MSRSRHWRRPVQTVRETGAKQLHRLKKMEKVDYTEWSNERLIERIGHLEKELKNKYQSLVATGSDTLAPEKKTWKKPRHEREFDPSKYNTRLVAFKLAYLGKKYNGFEHHTGNTTPLPTIEEELWKAFNKARLIFPKGSHPLEPGEVNWEGCEYSKCGRTDKGVSAFGQVIGIRVRSNRPMVKKKAVVDGETNATTKDMNNTHAREDGIEIGSPTLMPSRSSPPLSEPENISILDPEFQETLNFDPISDEIPYCSLLNRLLPPDIRILAWCPFPPPDFSARFSCRERQYKYFFTNPCFPPIPHNLEPPRSKKNAPHMKDGWLDIEAMKEAAKLFEGVHDFRNFCKCDPSKQITNYERIIYHSSIEQEADVTSSLFHFGDDDYVTDIQKPGYTYPDTFTFNLHGSAFLWHQVRHIVAILFLVGQGLEQPSIVTELLNVEKNPCKPTYEMASDTPLILWDCIFPQEGDESRTDALQWLYVGDGPKNAESKYGPGGLLDDLWKNWRERKMDELLAGTLIDVVTHQGVAPSEAESGKMKNKSQKIFDGGDTPKLQGTYKSVMNKPKMEDVRSQNDRYAVRKGFESAEHWKSQGFKRVKSTDRPGMMLGEGDIVNGEDMEIDGGDVEMRDAA